MDCHQASVRFPSSLTCSDELEWLAFKYVTSGKPLFGFEQCYLRKCLELHSVTLMPLSCRASIRVLYDLGKTICAHCVFLNRYWGCLELNAQVDQRNKWLHIKNLHWKANIRNLYIYLSSNDSKFLLYARAQLYDPGFNISTVAAGSVWSGRN